jgi:uncharacterized SAM-binding protein YcdF (DUF218 family)
LSKTTRRLGILAIFLCLLAVALGATHNIWLRWLGEYLTYTEPPCKADMIVVLAGDFSGHRISRAAELLKAGWAPKVLVSGTGYCYGFNEGDLAIQYIARAGYPPDEFFNLPSPARSTTAEVQYIVPELRRRGVHRFILVTSNFPTRRAAGIFRRTAPDLPFRVVAAPDNDFTPDGWWHNREGRKTAFTEWLKTVADVLGV